MRPFLAWTGHTFDEAAVICSSVGGNALERGGISIPHLVHPEGLAGPADVAGHLQAQHAGAWRLSSK